MDNTTTAIVLILEVVFFILVIAWYGYKLLAAKPEEEPMDPNALADHLGLPRKVTLPYLQQMPPRDEGQGTALIILTLLVVTVLFILTIIFGIF
jgi:hypothetical protein